MPYVSFKRAMSESRGGSLLYCDGHARLAWRTVDGLDGHDGALAWVSGVPLASFPRCVVANGAHLDRAHLDNYARWSFPLALGTKASFDVGDGSDVRSSPLSHFSGGCGQTADLIVESQRTRTCSPA